MSDDLKGPQVRLHKQKAQLTWEEIDTVLASYAGFVRVFGTHMDDPGMAFRIGGYRIASEVGLLAKPASVGGATPLSAHPRYWTQTIYVFEKIEEARHFAVRFQQLVASTELVD